MSNELGKSKQAIKQKKKKKLFSRCALFFPLFFLLVVLAVQPRFSAVPHPNLTLCA
jgi:hypothetical protein